MFIIVLLPGTGRPDDRDELAGLDAQAHVVEGGYGDPAHVVHAADAVERDDGDGHGLRPSSITTLRGPAARAIAWDRDAPVAEPAVALVDRADQVGCRAGHDGRPLGQART